MVEPDGGDGNACSTPAAGGNHSRISRGTIAFLLFLPAAIIAHVARRLVQHGGSLIAAVVAVSICGAIFLYFLIGDSALAAAGLSLLDVFLTLVLLVIYLLLLPSRLWLAGVLIFALAAAGLAVFDDMILRTARTELPKFPYEAAKATTLGLFSYALFRAVQHFRNLKEGRVTWSEAYWDDIATGGAAAAAFGDGGAGKSTLIGVMQDEYLRNELLKPPGFIDYGDTKDRITDANVQLFGGEQRYNVTSDVRSFEVAHLRCLEDGPGQTWKPGPCRSSADWSCRIENLAKRSRNLVILNVLTFGYSGRIKRRDWSDNRVLVEEGEEKTKSLCAFRADVLKNEICATTKLFKLVSKIAKDHPRSSITVLNVVNMAGFWWDKAEEARAFYEGRSTTITGIEFPRLKDFVGGAPKLAKIFHSPFLPASLLFADMTVSNEDTGGRVAAFRVVGQNDVERSCFQRQLRQKTLDTLQTIHLALYRTQWSELLKGGEICAISQRTSSTSSSPSATAPARSKAHAPAR